MVKVYVSLRMDPTPDLVNLSAALGMGFLDTVRRLRREREMRTLPSLEAENDPMPVTMVVHTIILTTTTVRELYNVDSHHHHNDNSTMEAFCLRHLQQLRTLDDNSRLLPESSQRFLVELDLPAIHPLCQQYSTTTTVTTTPSVAPAMAPDMGPAPYPVDLTLMERLITNYWYYVYPTLALARIWVFFFAGYVAPLCLLWLLWMRLKRSPSQKVEVTPLMERYPIVSFTTLVTSWVILTDDGYVLEFGRQYGAFLLLATVATLQPKQQKHMVLLLFLFAICSELSPWACEDPEHRQTTLIQSGVYFNADNPTVNRTVSIWQETLPDYSQVATPWQWTGDARTGMSYALNYVDRDPVFHRVWLPTEDKEFVALDVAFPDDGHSWEQPLYLVLHGLNGGSTEGYVVDFARSRNQAGSTVVVMIARGLDDTPLQGWTIFHGARTIDAHSAATILRDRVKGPEQVLAGVGYSLGAIVLNHYVSSARENAALDVSVSISGALACNYQQTFVRSQRIWQPVIVAHMKEHFFVSKWGHRLYHQLGREMYQQLLRSRHIVESDRYVSVLYNGYKNHDHFYASMSSVLFDPRSSAHIISAGHFVIPHLILQALDDPISTWRTIASNDPENPLFPSNLVNSPETQNVVVLLTEKGGHVGWPVGWKPHSWIYMNDWVAANFVSAYAKERKLLG